MSKRRPAVGISSEGINPPRRKCVHKGCITILAAENPGLLCFMHQHAHRTRGRLRDLLEELDLLSTIQATRLDDNEGLLPARTFHGRQDDDTGSFFPVVQRWGDQEGPHLALQGTY